MALAIALAVVAATAALLFYSEPTDYEATVVVQFPSVSLENFGSLSYGAPSEPVLDPAVVRRAGRRADVDPERIEESVSISSDRESATVTITAEAKSSEAAREIADAVAFDFVTFYRTLLSGQLTRAREFVDFLREEGKEDDVPKEQLRSLKRDDAELEETQESIEEATAPGVVESAQVRAASPLSGTAVRGAVIAAVGGLLLAFLLTRLLARVDRGRRTADRAG